MSNLLLEHAAKQFTEDRRIVVTLVRLEDIREHTDIQDA